jgi:hypothetical protein
MRNAMDGLKKTGVGWWVGEKASAGQKFDVPPIFRGGFQKPRPPLPRLAALEDR